MLVQAGLWKCVHVQYCIYFQCLEFWGYLVSLDSHAGCCLRRFQPCSEIEGKGAFHLLYAMLRANGTSAPFPYSTSFKDPVELIFHQLASVQSQIHLHKAVLLPKGKPALVKDSSHCHAE